FYKKGALYNQQKFDTTVRDIQERYANKGYLRAEIVPVPALDEETGLLNINFDITENNIVFIDHVDVTGNDSTKTYVFTRELTVKEGDVFSYDKIRRSQGKILNLGFINDAQIDITPTNDINKVDVGFNVLEGRPGMFTAGIAMSSLDGLYGDVSVNHLNLFGKAQRLSLRALFGSKILDYTVSWSTPWIFDKPTSFGIDAFNTRRYRSYLTNNSAYTERRIGGRLHLGPRFNDDIYNLGLSYTFESIEVYDINPDIKAGLLAQDGLVEGKNNMSTLGASFAIDTRDNYWDATSGARNSLGVDLSGGPFMGETDIYRFTLRSSYNKTLINIGKDYPIVLMIANRAGMVKPYGGTEVVPAYERVFLGGADTIRGYETTGQIGPQKGGEIYYIGNVELKFPIAREGRRTIAQLAAFFDIGNSWKEWGDIRFKTGPAEDEFKMGFGFGLRFTTPSLPIRLDWGYGLNHKTGEKKSQIYFSMANLF
ncbi:MAG: outer membrane protein assembly factor BamA, partial [Elusimicrobiota bacterium]|nr:outer membrane protein assembly factor BamA [Elusimicrobiota bacterium]